LDHGKNVKPKPKCLSTCLETTQKISESLDKKQAFYDKISKAISHMHMYSNILAQIIFSAKHNLQFYAHKKVDRIRSIVQKIGVKLMHFSIYNDFWKFGKNLKIKSEPRHENGRER
jgi:hypothetical protein